MEINSNANGCYNKAEVVKVNDELKSGINQEMY